MRFYKKWILKKNNEIISFYANDINNQKYVSNLYDYEIDYEEKSNIVFLKNEITNFLNSIRLSFHFNNMILFSYFAIIGFFLLCNQQDIAKSEYIYLSIKLMKNVLILYSTFVLIIGIFTHDNSNKESTLIKKGIYMIFFIFQMENNLINNLIFKCWINMVIFSLAFEIVYFICMLCYKLYKYKKEAIEFELAINLLTKS